MGYIADLKLEIDTDPLGRNYDAMTIHQVASSLNVNDRQKDKASLTGSEIWEATNVGEFNELTDSEKSQWLALCGINSVNPFGSAEQLTINIFGTPASSTTTAALVSVRVENISRAKELSFTEVKPGHVEMAKA